jgi:hypothetical protein
MRARISLIGSVLILVALMLVLTPLASSTPPDPTWIAGFWDDDDFDNVVDCITSAAGLFQAPVSRELPLKLPAVDTVIALVPLSASGPRAPPTV